MNGSTTDPFGVTREPISKAKKPQEEPYLPAYTLQRRPIPRKVKRKRILRSAAVGGAIGGGAGLLLGGPKGALVGGGVSAAASGALTAATQPRYGYEMRRIHGVSARPTAPGQKPTITVRKPKAKPKDPQLFDKAYSLSDAINQVRDASATQSPLAAGRSVYRRVNAGFTDRAEQARQRRERMKQRIGMASEPIGKANDRGNLGDAGQAAAGLGLVAGAANASRVEDRVRQAAIGMRRQYAQRLDGVYGYDERGRVVRSDPRPAPGSRTPRQKARAKAIVRRKYGRLNTMNRVTAPAIKGMPNKAKVGAMVAGYGAGGLLAWKGARDLAAPDPVTKAVTRRDVDAAAAGAAAGAGGYQVAMYSTKPIDRAIERKWSSMDDSPAKGGPGSPTKIMAQHRKEVGLPRNARLGDPRWLKYWRTTPKTVPGWRYKRTMSHLHGGKTGVALTTGMGAVAAGGAVAASRRRRQQTLKA